MYGTPPAQPRTPPVIAPKAGALTLARNSTLVANNQPINLPTPPSVSNSIDSKGPSVQESKSKDFNKIVETNKTSNTGNIETPKNLPIKIDSGKVEVQKNDNGSLNIKAPPNTPVVSTQDGRVVFVDQDNGKVNILNTDGTVSNYSNLKEVPNIGDMVSKGAQIGTVGDKGEIGFSNLNPIDKDGLKLNKEQLANTKLEELQNKLLGTSFFNLDSEKFLNDSKSTVDKSDSQSFQERYNSVPKENIPSYTDSKGNYSEKNFSTGNGNKTNKNPFSISPERARAITPENAQEFIKSKNKTASTDLSPKARAFLDVIAFAEGADYNVMYTGATFDNLGDHPRQLKSGGGYTSDAAGRYQFLSTTWDSVKGRAGAIDFSEKSQDKGAIELVKGRGGNVEGDFETEIKKLGGEWASLPGSPYGQPTKPLEVLKGVYEGRLKMYENEASNSNIATVTK